MKKLIYATAFLIISGAVMACGGNKQAEEEARMEMEAANEKAGGN